MFSGKLLISRVKKIHFQSPQVVHNTHGTTYDELLSMSSMFQFIRDTYVFSDVFKLVNNINPHSLWDYFKINFLPCDLRKGNTFHLPPRHSAHHAINSLLFRGSLPWNNFPREIKVRRI